MRRTQNRAAARGSRLYLFRGLLFTLVAASAWVLINVQNLQEFLNTYQKREQEREQIDVLKQRIQRLKRQQQSLAYNGIETEKQVRERMNLHLPGEQVLFLKEEEAPAANSAENARPESAKPTAPRADSAQAGGAAVKTSESSGSGSPGASAAATQESDGASSAKTKSRREKPGAVNKSESVQ